MKKVLGILVLGLFLITPSWADDIQDLEIEGMSIGESLLDYLSREKIIAEIEKNKPYGKKPETGAQIDILTRGRKCWRPTPHSRGSCQYVNPCPSFEKSCI